MSAASTRSHDPEDIRRDQLDDADLAAIRKGATDAFARLYERYEDEVRGLCFKRVGRDALDEVVQKIFVAAWEKLVAGHSVKHLRPWLYGVTRVVCLKHRGHVARDRRIACMTDLENGQCDETMEWGEVEAADYFDAATLASCVQIGRQADTDFGDPPRAVGKPASRQSRNIRPWPHAAHGAPGTVGDLVCRYHEAARHEFTVQHFRSVQLVLDAMMEFASTPARDIDEAFVVSLRLPIGGSQDSRRRIRTIVRSCVRWGIKCGLVDELPAICPAAEAAKMNRKWRVDEMRQDSPQWAPGTLGAIVPKFCEEVIDLNCSGHRKRCRMMAEWITHQIGHKALCDITSTDIDSIERDYIMGGLGGSLRTKKVFIGLIRNLFRWAVTNGLLSAQSYEALNLGSVIPNSRVAKRILPDAEQWLRDTLSNGAVRVSEVKARARDVGLSIDRLRNARHSLDVLLVMGPCRSYYWALRVEHRAALWMTEEKVAPPVVRDHDIGELSVLVQQWAAAKTKTKKVNSVTTMLLDMGARSPRDVTERRLEWWMTEAYRRGYKVLTINHRRKFLGELVKWAMAEGLWSGDNPVRRQTWSPPAGLAWAQRVDKDDDNDLAVIREQGAGQREAFDRITHRHWRRIAGTCAKVLRAHGVHPTRVETDLVELVQDVFVEFWMTVGVRGRDIPNVASFLISSARRHHCKRYLRALDAKRVVIFTDNIAALSRYQYQERDEHADAIPYLADRLRMGDVETVVEAAVLMGGLDRSEVARRLGRYRQAKGVSKALTLAPVGSSRLMEELAIWDRSLCERGWSAKARRANHRIIEQLCEFAGWESGGECTPDGIVAYLRRLGETGRTPETCKKVRCAITNFVKVVSPEAFERCFNGEWRGGAVLNTQAA